MRVSAPARANVVMHYWLPAMFLTLTTPHHTDAADEPVLRISGKLVPTAAKYLDRPSATHAVQLKAGNAYRVDLISSAFRPFILVKDPKGRTVAFDPGSGFAQNARLLFCPVTTGKHELLVMSTRQRIGDYLLAVRMASIIKEEQGQLTTTSPPDKQRPLCRAQTHQLFLRGGTEYCVSVSSDQFDAFLRIEGPSGGVIGFNDDSTPECTDARLSWTAPRDGTYRIVVSNSTAGQTGAYILRVASGASPSNASTALTREMVYHDALSDEDLRDRVAPTHPRKEYWFKLKANGCYQFDLESEAFDSFLVLEDASGNLLGTDDDSGGGLNARLVWQAPANGEFMVAATAFDQKVGPYRLTARPIVFGVQRSLSSSDSLDTRRTQSFRQIHTVSLEANQHYRIDLSSKAFDAYLRLEDIQGNQLAFNDDAYPGTHDSRIDFQPPRTAEYRVIVTTYGPRETGRYTLTIAATH